MHGALNPSKPWQVGIGQEEKVHARLGSSASPMSSALRKDQTNQALRITAGWMSLGMGAR
jgi:hypothetical protein